MGSSKIAKTDHLGCEPVDADTAAPCCGRIGKELRGKPKEVQRRVDEMLPKVVRADDSGLWAKSGYWRSRASAMIDRMVTITFLIGVVGELPKGFIYFEYPVIDESCLQIAVESPPLGADSEVTPVEKLPGPPLEYPPLARRARLEAAVLIEMVIDADGRVTGACVNRSTSTNEAFDFKQTALAHVETWRYRPAQVNGEPVPIRMTVVSSLP